jgi:CRISPR-associated protein Cas2
MLVMTLEKVPPRLRGYLSRWLVEIDTGVYVGRVSTVVRDLLWEKSVQLAGSGRLTQAWSARTEQGYAFRLHGGALREPVDFDGLVLVARRSKADT